EVGEDHALFGIELHPRAEVPERLRAADVHHVARAERRLVFLIPRRAREAEVHESDADVDEVAAVPAAGAEAHPRERRDIALLLAPHPRRRPAVELLRDAREHEEDRE